MPDILQMAGAADRMPWLTILTVSVAAYILGCFNAGYYFVRWRSGLDIRTEGSGVTGATNVGRKLGKAAFAFTMGLDMAKGALAAALARGFGLKGAALLIAMLAVIMGHIWPVQLGFRGGKGAATLGGTLFATDHMVALLIILLSLPFYAFMRRFTPAGLFALALVTPVLAIAGRPGGQVLSMALLLAPVMLAHVPNVREEYAWLRDRWRAGNSEAAAGEKR